MTTKRLNLAFTRAGNFVMTGGVSVDMDWPYTEKELEEKLMNREFAEFLPLQLEFDEDDWDFEEIKEDDDSAA